MTTLAAMVRPDEIDGLWGTVEHLIVRGLKRGTGNFQALDIKESVARGTRQLWVAIPNADWALVTQIDIYPRAKVCNIFMLSGKMPAGWLKILAGIERWAKELGCNAMELRGRKGWLRKLPGYDSPAVFMRKEI